MKFFIFLLVCVAGIVFFAPIADDGLTPFEYWSKERERGHKVERFHDVMRWGAEKVYEVEKSARREYERAKKKVASRVHITKEYGDWHVMHEGSNYGSYGTYGEAQRRAQSLQRQLDSFTPGKTSKQRPKKEYPKYMVKECWDESFDESNGLSTRSNCYRIYRMRPRQEPLTNEVYELQEYGRKLAEERCEYLNKHR